jgi:uncharacterized protein involved in exopolysaccharide biosynthesis/Mrp family chromosome partitioning ATPase
MQTSTASTGRVAQAIDELDLGALGRALWRRKPLIFALTLLAASIAFLAVNVITPRYKSEARVLIETRENIFLRPEAERSLERGTTVDQEAVTSQVQLILSRDLALEVIRKLKLGERPEFDPVLRGTSAIRTVLGLVGLVRDPMSQTPEERVLRSYSDRLAAFQVEKSRVIAIEFESEDPELAAQVVNAIADGYLVLQQTAKQSQSRAAGEFLSGEIDKLRSSLAELEGKVEQHRANTNLLIGTNNTNLSSQQLGDFNAQLGAARGQKADAESKAKVIREALKRGAPAEFSEIINSEFLRRLSEQHATLRAQLAEQSSTLMAQHPRIKELRAQISDLERQLRLEADRLARSFENDAQIAAGRVESLSATLDQIKKQASSTNAQDVQLRALEREAKSRRDLLESYMLKYREATARDNVSAASPEARIISRGIVSTTPSWPKKLPTVLVAALGMFVLSVGFILTGQLMRGGGAPGIVLTERASVSAYADTPAAAAGVAAAPPPAVRAAAGPVAPPGTASAPPAAAATATPSVASRILSVLSRKPAGKTPATKPQAAAAALPPAPAMDSARAGVGVPVEAVEGLAQALGTAGESGRRIAVVGARRNMGTTLAAISLARALAKQGRAVLIDLALDSPNLSAVAAEPNVPGLSELVAGSASFGQIITRDKYSRVHLITLGRSGADGPTILASQQLAIALEALARSYDYVVIDAGALPQIAAERLAKFAPRAVLVAEELDGAATESARAQLLSAGFPNVSVLASGPQGPQLDAGGRRAAA